MAFEAAVEVVNQAEAAEAVAALAKERLNAVDRRDLTERWATSSQVVRLTPAAGPTPAPRASPPRSGLARRRRWRRLGQVGARTGR